ncbi:MAG: hypothetical protein DCC68_20765 [Planctomycetota bacterium]|nr:MAG: hypothetical protein DCC68_20765 [Planctomycetota bacterium]
MIRVSTFYATGAVLSRGESSLVGLTSFASSFDPPNALANRLAAKRALQILAVAAYYAVEQRRRLERDCDSLANQGAKEQGFRLPVRESTRWRRSDRKLEEAHTDGSAVDQ